MPLNMRYSVVPSWMTSETEISHATYRTLAMMCCFTSANGICYPNQFTLAKLRGVSQQAISQQINNLRAVGAVIDLEPIGKKHPNAFQRGNRYFIPLMPSDCPPPLEHIKNEYLSNNRRPPNV